MSVASQRRALNVSIAFGLFCGLLMNTVTTLDAQTPSVRTIRTTHPLMSRGRIGAISADAFGNIIVSNFDQIVWRIRPDGEVETLANNLRGSSGNTVAPDGVIYQASFMDGRIIRIQPDGQQEDLVSSGLRGPVGLVVQPDGSLLACECRGAAIARIAPDGAVSPFAQHPDLDCPNGIVRGPDGAYYVVSFNNGFVLRIDATGQATRFATVPDSSNAHIAYAAGAFWVTTITTNRLYRVGLDGQVTLYTGDGSVGFADGPVTTSTLARPNGITAAVDGQSVIVNTLRGAWRGNEATEIVLRQIELPVEPEEFERLRLRVDDLVFDALATGPEDGELVMLLHGFPQTADAFRGQLRALGAAGYRAVAPDQRGYSPDARPVERTAYVMPNFVRDLLGMVDALGRERFHLVGHDWGGAVAWAAGTFQADRIQSLTVLSTPHYAALGAARTTTGSDQAQRSSYFADFSRPDAADRFLENDMALLRQILAAVPPDQRARYIRRLGTRDALKAALAWYHIFDPSVAGAGGTGGAVAPVTIPTMYIWGTADQSFGPAAVEATADFVTGPYEFHRLEGVGHWVPELAIDRVNELLIAHLNRWGTRGDSG